MSLEEFINRVRYRLDGYFHSEKRSVKFLARFLAFTLFAAVISTIAPTLADELADDPSMMQPVASEETTSTVTIAPTETSTASPTPDPTFSPEPEISRPAISNTSAEPLPEGESSESATANGPGVALEIQPRYILKIPATGGIDPRATTYFLPLIYAANEDPEVEFTMVCISAPAVRFDLGVKGVANNSIEGEELITGDQSGQLIISAKTNRVINLINSVGGLFLSSNSGGLAGRSLTFRFVAVTKPVADPEICSAAQSGAITTVRALGLDLSTVKGGGRLK
ncbi:MAG: hypothetical protein F2555_00780 [Actinobacteria bacterium]|uniref:Unannotated protein n=1 Tax=freshwater metagenome TaxID=449393 RepID=A0A6J6DGG6_9ZZZZ|nr:hypothetical protein [Actinomycetota bacterium]